MKRQKRLWTAAAVCAVLGATCRAVPGVRFAGLLFWCLTALLIVFALLAQYSERAWAKWGQCVLLVLVCLGLVAFGYLESLVIRDAHTDGRAEDAQCVIILGAGVNGTTPSLMLSSRLRAALDFIADKPDIPIICSGGQGPGEDISEADCMADWLIAHGVDESRIYREDKSTSTQENLRYSRAILEELGVDPAQRVAIVTSDFHLCRARLMWGGDTAAVPAHLPSTLYFQCLTVNYFIREAFGLAAYFVYGG